MGLRRPLRLWARLLCARAPARGPGAALTTTYRSSIPSSPPSPWQIVGEYGGPRLRDSRAQRGAFLLQIPETSVFIDGDHENSPFGVHDGRYVVVFSNHDHRPNAKLCTWSNGCCKRHPRLKGCAKGK